MGPNISLSFLLVSTSIFFALVACQDVHWDCGNKAGTAAITFDDGPGQEKTWKTLDVLRDNNVKATFFLVGLGNFETNVTRYKETVQRMFEEKNLTAFRPPFGSYDDRVLRIIQQECNYDVIMWSVDTMDWFHKENTNLSIEEWINAVEEGGVDGSYIGLQHDHASGPTNLTQMTIDLLKSSNITMTTVADCIGRPMYA